MTNRLKQAWLALFNRKPRPQSAKQLAHAELQAWRPIGGTFRYLGRECVVTGHSEVHFSGVGVHWWPQLKAEYADDLGVIRYVQFSMAEARAIMGAQP